MPRELEGKSIVITGAGRGIGAALAIGLAEVGAAVTIGDIDVAAAQETADRIVAQGGQALAHATDVTSRASLCALLDAAGEKFGSLHGIVNNAGVALTRRFLETTEEDFNRLMSINSLGTLMGMQEAAKHLIGQGTPGKIVNMASIAAKQGFEPLSLYSASKFSVAAFTQAGAKALGSNGITVNAICPGIVATDMWQVIGRGFKESGLAQTDTEAFETFSAGILLGRPSTPADLVGVARFLLSSASDYMTGQTLVVDGGMIFP